MEPESTPSQDTSRDSPWSPQLVFCVVAAVFGLAFVIVSPPLDPSDERRHLQRAWVHSEGYWLPIGGAEGHRHPFPRSLFELHVSHRSGEPCRHTAGEIWETLRTPVAAEDVARISRPLPYGPLAYAPQAAALWVGRTLDVSAGALLYLGRLATLAPWILLVWFAIRTTPIRQWAFAVLALLPMSLYSASSLSADAITNASGMLLCALVLRAAVGPEPHVSPNLRRSLIGVSVLLGLVKPGYWTLVLALVLIPGQRFEKPRDRILLLAACAAAVCVTTGLWAVALRVAETVSYSPDSAGQAWLLLTQPGHFVGVLFDTFREYGLGMGAGFLGILGHLDVQLPAWAYFALPAALLAATVLDGPDPEILGPGRRSGFAAVALVCALCIPVLLYVGAGQPDSAYLYGLQGRHFVPIAPLLLVAVPAVRDAGGRNLALGVAAVAAATLTAGVVALLSHYY